MVAEAKPPMPLVTSHSRDSAAGRLPGIARPKGTGEWSPDCGSTDWGATGLLFFGVVFATVRSSVLGRLEPLGHQETSLIVVACAAIQIRGRVVALINFE